MPKPGKKHRYCGVCRRQYDEYLEVTAFAIRQHIQSPSHIASFKQHRFIGLITNIIKETYGEGNIREEKKVLLSSVR